MRRIYKLVNTVEKVDDRTVKFSFGPGYDRETVMIIAMMPVLSKKWWEGRDFDATTLDTPLLNGPYKIASVDPGRRIVYERVPDYWAKDLLVNKGQNNFDRLIYDYYRDDTVAFEAFKTGDLDLRREFDAGKWASAYDFPAVKNGDVITEALPHGRPERVRALIMNSRRPPFDDPRVREALQYVLDFNWVNDNLFHGKYKRIGSYFPNAELAATGTPDEKQLAVLEPFREKLRPEIFGTAWQPPVEGGQREGLKKADELLKQAGWIVQNGVRMKDGKPFTFEIILSAPEDEKIALAFLRGLKRLGITANVRMLDSAAFLGRLNDYDYDMVLYYWLNSLSPGTEQMLYWSCEAAKQPARFNYAGICDAAVDGLAQSIAASTDRADLVARARALDRVLTWGNYMIPLYYMGQDFAAYRKFVHHPAHIPLYGMVLETWWADPATKSGGGAK
jgi:ABC-type oligopeptide transport system substrate-binding subunit